MDTILGDNDSLAVATEETEGDKSSTAAGNGCATALIPQPNTLPMLSNHCECVAHEIDTV